jgi:malate synthase
MIDTLTAAFALDEIIFELRDHVAALGQDGWRFAASVIAHSEAFKGKALPERAALGPILAAVSGLMINTAHKRGCLALGSLIAETPGQKDAARQQAGTAVRAGFDGVMVAHAEVVPLAASMFNDDMPTPNQIYVTRDDTNTGPAELLKPIPGAVNEESLRSGIGISLIYFEGWLRGRGSVVINGAVEEAASAELRWMQIWQWLHQAVKLGGGGKVTAELFETLLGDEVKRLRTELGEEAYRNGRYKDAAALLKSLCLAERLAPGFEATAMRKLL